jgi:hypothetical protein
LPELIAKTGWIACCAWSFPGVWVSGLFRGAERPTLVMSLHSVTASGPSPRWRLVTAPFRLPANEPLSHQDLHAEKFYRAHAEFTGPTMPFC